MSGRQRVFWVLAVCYAAVIWWLSSQSAPEGPSVAWKAFAADLFHFPLFGGLALVLAEALYKHESTAAFSASNSRSKPELAREEEFDRTPPGRAGLVRAGVSALAATLSYGIVDEIHQSTTPGRSPDAWDVVTDMLGAGTCLWLWMQVRSGRLGLRAFAVAAGIGAAAVVLIALRQSVA